MSGSANDHNAVKKEMLEQLFAKGCQGNDGMTADQLVDLFASADSRPTMHGRHGSPVFQ